MRRFAAAALLSFASAAAVPALLPVPCAAAEAQAASPLAGTWKGDIDVPGSKLGIILKLKEEAGALAGTISIPVQGLSDVPLRFASSGADAAKFSIEGIPGDPTFDAKLSADGATLSGPFTQGGAAFTFSVQKSSALAEAKARMADFPKFLEEAREAWKVPGFGIAIIKDGEPILVDGFGMRDREQNLKATKDTLFAIGSSTKAFTTYVMATLVEEGKLDWDKPVREYLPALRFHSDLANEMLTPRDMVTHRSGMPRHDLVWYNREFALADLPAKMPTLEFNATPRALFQYNNLMFGLSGHLSETLTGKTWEDLVRERIFQPLGMEGANFSVLDSQKSADFALPYEERDGAIRRMAFRDIRSIGPAGSINASAAHLVPWMQLHLGGGKFGGKQLLSAPLMEELHTIQMATPGPQADPDLTSDGYAMGWFVDTYRGHRRVHHGGNIDGFSALVMMFPQDGIGIAILTNMNGTGFNGTIARHAADRLLGLEQRDWSGERLKRKEAATKEADAALAKSREVARKPGTKPAHPLADYAGTYTHPAYGTVEVALAGEELSFRFSGIETPLEHWHFEVFNGRKRTEDVDHTFEESKVMFQTNVDGEIASLSMALEPAVKDIVFERQGDAKLSDPAYIAQFAGEYELSGAVVTVSVRDKSLTVLVPGQPLYTMVPLRNDRFGLKDLQGYSVQFVKGADGAVSDLQFIQPNGVFTAKRK